MSLQKDYDEKRFFSDASYEEETENVSHKREVRKKIEDYLEQKRLKEELEDEFDADFRWDDLKC